MADIREERVTCAEVALPGGEVCFQITLQAPRANALEPQVLGDLHAALDALQQSGATKALLRTAGRNFSSGGDVAGFYRAAQEGRADVYADQVVPVLQDLVMRIIDMPVLFAAAIRGATTGGSAGLIFASDLVIAAPDAFLQPYYGVMGFAPDGGWTAVLPELIGAGPAQGWLHANLRHEADQLLALGLVQAVDDAAEDRALALLDGTDAGTALATKTMIWTAERRARVRAGLDAETAAFRRLITRQQTLARMTSFLTPEKGTRDV
ncbi:enoyl-CoA hydratase/isomerase family protein [Thalassobius sp. Cn5-15]|uniref:enoyl-CoA hydratase/isomerase family protein n=1 Tax=Thalassobius sp. Cn5-15 TaxID=2917763 RepID=UPI001EF2BFD0|nr:enoyl-CoA hydratase/isomerase family protein [Thalassobius sp. Cn5-15]MCG7493270.1 enoyl-CoA hydratase/isomerase family protein [Thalassobius sp. Cn5-15]